METFERLGYVRVNGSEEDWDVLWSHDYPFGGLLMHDLEPHQRVCQLLLMHVTTGQTIGR